MMKARHGEKMSKALCGGIFEAICTCQLHIVAW